MANLTKWAAGGLYSLTWTNCGFTLADFNSLANGGFVLGSATQTNSSSLDILAELSFLFTVGGTTVATSFIGVYLLPLNRDGSTFGDGTPTGAALPTDTYLVDTIRVRAGITSGNTITGITRRPIQLPPGDFRWGIGNGLGVALNASAAAQVQARSSVIDLNG